MDVRPATTDADLQACYPVLAQLRPHLEAAAFVAHVRRLEALAGLRLVAARAPGDPGGAVCAVAGYRVSEWLAGGRYLEIEDLVTDAAARGRGYGAALFDWLVARARADGCAQVRLVSATHRVDAHRFYRARGMAHTAGYFALDV